MGGFQSTATSAEMWTELEGLGEVAGTSAAFDAAALAGPALAVGATAAAGWLIGTQIRQMFLPTTTIPKPGLTQNSQTVTKAKKGTIITSLTSPGANPPINADMKMPGNGVYLKPAQDSTGCPTSVQPTGVAPPYQLLVISVVNWQACGSFPKGSTVVWQQTGWVPLRVTGPPRLATQNDINGAGLSSGGTPDPGLSNVTNAVKNMDCDVYGQLCNWLDAQLGGDSPDPIRNTAVVPQPLPSEVTTHYVTRLTNLGFANVVTHTLDFNGADVSKPHDALVTMDPAGGSRVATSTQIDVYGNPGDAAMPRVIPAPQDGEDYNAYVQRLHALGVVGQVQVLSGTAIDSDVGPNDISAVSPAPGARVQKGSTVTVKVNPPDAPPPTGEGSCDPWVKPNIDLGPLNAPIPDVFPFGIFAWVYDSLGGWDVAGSAPVLHIPIHGSDFKVDFNQFEPAMQVVRPVIVILSLIGLVWLVATAALGLGAPAAQEE